MGWSLGGDRWLDRQSVTQLFEICDQFGPKRYAIKFWVLMNKKASFAGEIDAIDTLNWFRTFDMPDHLINPTFKLIDRDEATDIQREKTVADAQGLGHIPAKASDGDTEQAAAQNARQGIDD